MNNFRSGKKFRILEITYWYWREYRGKASHIAEFSLCPSTLWRCTKNLYTALCILNFRT